MTQHELIFLFCACYAEVIHLKNQIDIIYERNILNEMHRYFINLFLFIFFTVFSPSFVQSQTPVNSKPAPTNADWKVTKQKNFPFYKVQILTKDNPHAPLGIEGTKAVITDLTGKTKAEIKNMVIEPDPKINVEGWAPGTLLDLDKDGYEDLLLRVFTGGAHCCSNYEIYSLGKTFKKLGSLKLQDCGETIQLKDLNGDGIWEIVTCNSSFTYFKDIPYSRSPFPPMIFGLEKDKFVNQDKKYPQIFDQDIADQKKDLQERGYSDGDVIQILLDYLLTNRESQGWQEFDQLYVSPNKEAVRNEILEKWKRYSGLTPETKPLLPLPETKGAVPIQP